MASLGHYGAALAFMAVATGFGVAQAGSAPAAKTSAKAVAVLVDAQDKKIGKVKLTQQADGLLLHATVSGMKPGSYGFHIHTTGKCDKPDFASAGGHWNPTAHKHGKDAPEGPHMGDLPNIDVAANGKGALEQKIPGAMLAGGDHPLFDADGAAVMLHAGPDDYKTDPAGNSGPRIACGVVTAGK